MSDPLELEGGLEIAATGAIGRIEDDLNGKQKEHNKTNSDHGHCPRPDVPMSVGTRLRSRLRQRRKNQWRGRQETE
jgi:hypothetical protein